MASFSPEAAVPERLRLLNGCPCVVLRDEEHAIAELQRLVSSKRGGYSVAINAEKITLYGSRPDVRELIDRASLPYADGAGAVLALKWLYRQRAKKINMPLACLAGAERHGWRVFVLGAREEVSRKAVDRIREIHPNLRLVGRMNGYEPDERKIEVLKETQPDLVMVALGSPRQEIFASGLQSHVPGVFVVGCGGALDVLAGVTQRAPSFMVDNGLEWLYRLVREPWRWRRQTVLPAFFLRLVLARFKTFGRSF